MNFNSSENIQVNQNMKSKGKKSKVVKILIVFVILILVVTYFVSSYYIKSSAKEALKNDFFDQITKNDLSFFTTNELYTKIGQRMQDENYDSTSNIKLSTTMENNMFSKLDLSKFEFSYQSIKDNDKNTNYRQVSTRYAGNHLLTLDFVFNNEQFAIKSDEIVNKYVGINNSNTQNIANQLAGTEVDMSTLKKMKNFTFDRETIDFDNISQNSDLSKYVSILKNNISAEDVSKKENVVVTLDSEQISTTEYTVNLSRNEVSNILNEISQEIENDGIMSELVVDNVQEFENDSDGIVEYTDNDNVSEVSGQENNFNTSMEIWGENTANENTSVDEIPAVNTTENTTTTPSVENTVTNSSPESVANSVTNQTVTNETTTNTTVTNDVAQTNTAVENTVSEEQNVVHLQTTQPEEQLPEQQPTTEPTQVTNQETQVLDTTNQVEEEDNFRTQGYIEVNENSTYGETDDTFIIGENYEDTVKNIANWAEKIDWSSYLFTGAKANCTQEELVEKLQNILAEKIEQNNTLVVKMYVSNGQTIKMNFEFPETQESFDIEIISKGDNEKYLNITVLTGEGDDAAGHAISLYKKNADADIKTKIYINKIYKNKINQKTNINLETKGTLNSKKYTTDIELVYSDSDGEFKTEIENSLNFDVTPEITELNNDNCLFIDTISSEELLLTRDAIKQKTLDVLREKNRNLNIIDINNANSVVQQIEQNNTEPEDTAAKEEAKQILIQTISNKMREYLDAGTELKIEDLEGLEIPGHEVNISISSNLAIISVNGYKFKLDSDFNLSDS